MQPLGGLLFITAVKKSNTPSSEMDKTRTYESLQKFD